MEHPDEGLIHAWLDGVLPNDEALSVAAHVAQCEACAAAVAEARGFVAASSRIISTLDDVAGDVIPRGRAVTTAVIPSTSARVTRVTRPWWRQRGFAAAALLVVVAGSAVLTMPGGRGALRSRDLSMESADSATGSATGSPAPSETRIAMDEANQRDAAERAAAAPRAVMSAPVGRPAVAPAPRATSPVVGQAAAPGAMDGPARRPGGTAANASEASLADAAARATVIDTNLTRRSVTTTVVTAAKTANAPPVAPVAAARPTPPPPMASPLAVPSAASTLAGCYALVASTNASVAVRRVMPNRVRLTDSLTGTDRSYIARAIVGLQPDARLLWHPMGPDNVLLRVIAAGETTGLRLRMGGDGRADGVATRIGC